MAKKEKNERTNANRNSSKIVKTKNVNKNSHSDPIAIAITTNILDNNATTAAPTTATSTTSKRTSKSSAANGKNETNGKLIISGTLVPDQSQVQEGGGEEGEKEGFGQTRPDDRAENLEHLIASPENEEEDTTAEEEKLKVHHRKPNTSNRSSKRGKISGRSDKAGQTSGHSAKSSSQGKKLGKVSGHSGKVSGHSGKVSGHLGKVSGHSGKVSGHSGKVSGHLGKVSGHSGKSGKTSDHADKKITSGYSGKVMRISSRLTKITRSALETEAAAEAEANKMKEGVEPISSLDRPLDENELEEKTEIEEEMPAIAAISDEAEKLFSEIEQNEQLLEEEMPAIAAISDEAEKRFSEIEQNEQLLKQSGKVDLTSVKLTKSKLSSIYSANRIEAETKNKVQPVVEQLNPPEAMQVKSSELQSGKDETTNQDKPDSAEKVSIESGLLRNIKWDEAKIGTTSEIDDQVKETLVDVKTDSTGIQELTPSEEALDIKRKATINLFDTPDVRLISKRKPTEEEEGTVKTSRKSTSTRVSRKSTLTDKTEIRMQMKRTMKKNVKERLISKLCKCCKVPPAFMQKRISSDYSDYSSESYSSGESSAPTAEKTLRDLFCERTSYEHEFNLSQQDKDSALTPSAPASHSGGIPLDHPTKSNLSQKSDLSSIAQYVQQLQQYQHYQHHRHRSPSTDPSDPHRHDFHNNFLPSLDLLVNAIVPHYVHRHKGPAPDTHPQSPQTPHHHHHHHHHHHMHGFETTGNIETPYKHPSQQQQQADLPELEHLHHRNVTPNALHYLYQHHETGPNQGQLVLNLVDELMAQYYTGKAESYYLHSVGSGSSHTPADEAANFQILEEVLTKLQHQLQHPHHHAHHVHQATSHHHHHQQQHTPSHTHVHHLHHHHHHDKQTCELKDTEENEEESKCEAQYGCRCQNEQLTPLSRYDLEGKRVGCKILEPHLKSNVIKQRKGMEQIISLMTEAPKVAGLNPIESELFVKLIKNKQDIIRYDIPYILKKIEDADKKEKDRQEQERMAKIRQDKVRMLNKVPTNEEIYKKIMKKKLDLIKRCKTVWANKRKEQDLEIQQQQMSEPKKAIQQTTGADDEDDDESEDIIQRTEEMLRKRMKEETCQAISKDKKFERQQSLRMKFLHKITSEDNVKFFLEHYPKIRTLSERIAINSQADEQDDGQNLLRQTNTTQKVNFSQMFQNMKPSQKFSLDRKLTKTSLEPGSVKMSQKDSKVPLDGLDPKPKSFLEIIESKRNSAEKFPSGGAKDLNVEGIKVQSTGLGGRNRSNYGSFAESFLLFNTDDADVVDDSPLKNCELVHSNILPWTPRGSILPY